MRKAFTVAILCAVVLSATPASGQLQTTSEQWEAINAHGERKAAEVWTAAEAKYWQEVTVWVTKLEERKAAITKARNTSARQAATSYEANGSVNGYPCGGSLPPCYVLKRESGGNPTAENPVSSASGLWQFIDGTWNGYGGYSHASYAPPEVQNEKARQVWAGGAGCGHWSAC